MRLLLQKQISSWPTPSSNPRMQSSLLSVVHSCQQTQDDRMISYDLAKSSCLCLRPRMITGWFSFFVPRALFFMTTGWCWKAQDVCLIDCLFVWWCCLVSLCVRFFVWLFVVLVGEQNGTCSSQYSTSRVARCRKLAWLRSSIWRLFHRVVVKSFQHALKYARTCWRWQFYETRDAQL